MSILLEHPKEAGCKRAAAAWLQTCVDQHRVAQSSGAALLFKFWLPVHRLDCGTGELTRRRLAQGIERESAER